MMVGKRPGQRQLELRRFPPQHTEGQRRQRFGVTLPCWQGGKHPAPAAANEMGDDARELDIGILKNVDAPVFRLGAALDQGRPLARQIVQRTNGGRRDNTRTDQAIR